jgi:hypothetical protein
MEEETKIVRDIDYAKSIAQQKLVYNRKGRFVFDNIITKGVFIFLFAAGLFVSIDSSSYVMLIIILLYGAFLAHSLFHLNILVKIKGQGIVKNKEDAMTTLQYFYKDLTFSASEENMIRDVKRSTFNSGRDLIVLFEGEDVYFHKQMLMRGSSVFPLSGGTDNAKAIEIAKYFEELQAKSKL